MRTLLSTLVVGLFFVAMAIAAPKGGKAKQNHHGGKAMLGEKVKKTGTHQLDRHGKHTISVDVKDQKIAGFHVKHDTKGDVAVKKYKSTKKMASIEGAPSETQPADTDLGTTWIGYAYIDDDGYEEIYWFPYEMILDGDTGAVDYVPLS